jgi:K+-transporting ATPase KdpF subunit
MRGREEIKHGYFMDIGSDAIFRWVFGADFFIGLLAFGGMSMDWTIILALVIATVLVVYLAAALLKPEIFS